LDAKDEKRKPLRLFYSAFLHPDSIFTSNNLHYCKLLSKLTDEEIYKKKHLSMLIDYLWQKAMFTYAILSFGFLILLVSLALHSGSIGIHVVEPIILIVNILFTISELFQYMCGSQAFWKQILDF